MRRLTTRLRSALDAYPEGLALLLTFAVLWPLRFQTLGCLNRPCPADFTRDVDLGRLGQLTALYALPLLAVLLIFVPFRRLGQIVAAVLRGVGGALFGYFFMLLVINGSGLVRIELIYPYVLLTALFGLVVFTSRHLPLWFKVAALIGYALFFVPSGHLVNGDVYAYAFQNKVDRSGSHGYYGLLYAQLYLLLAKAAVAFAAFAVIDFETLGTLYVRARRVSYALRPRTRPRQSPPETVLPRLALNAPVAHRTPPPALGHSGPLHSEEAALAVAPAEPFLAEDEFTLPVLPCPEALFERERYAGEVVLFGGYVFHPLQFRVLQLLPQTRKAEQREQDYLFRQLRQRYYPQRNVNSTQMLLEVYSVLRHHDPDLLSTYRNGKREPARTNAARKLLIDWLIGQRIEQTRDYEFIDADRLFRSAE